MVPPDLNALHQFSVVARHLNFRRAALELAVAPSTLSDRIRELEDRMGVRLLNRTTRSASLTEDGERLYARSRAALETLAELAAPVRLGAQKSELTGRIRINGPRPAIELRLMPLVASFLADNPAVRMDIVTQGELVDVIEAGFDVGVRYDDKLEQDMIRVRMGPDQRMLIAGTPDYLARRGIPTGPGDLPEHDCIGTVFARGNVLPWSLERDGRSIEFVPRGNLLVNAIETSLIAARASLGLVYTFEDYIAADLAEGRLVPVLADWTPPFPGPSLYFFERRLMPPALRAFIDHVKSRSDA